MINRITLLLFIGLAFWSCEENIEKSCTDVMYSVQGMSGLIFDFNDSCEIIGQPFIRVYHRDEDDVIETEKPTHYRQLINDTLYTYQRYTTISTGQSFYMIASNHHIYDTTINMKYYFSGDTLFTHTNMDTCYREYQTNLVVSYAGSDSTLWCPPSVDEEPIFDTLYYKCSDYPSAYVADCWNIDNPWINN